MSDCFSLIKPPVFLGKNLLGKLFVEDYKPKSSSIEFEDFVCFIEESLKFVADMHTNGDVKALNLKVRYYSAIKVNTTIRDPWSRGPNLTGCFKQTGEGLKSVKQKDWDKAVYIDGSVKDPVSGLKIYFEAKGFSKTSMFVWICGISSADELLEPFAMHIFNATGCNIGQARHNSGATFE